MTNISYPLIIPNRPKPYLMAHRGNRVACPENTLAAFRRALVDGADIIETDLHLTADGVFVCIHDATVDRTTNGHGPVAEMTLAQMKSLSASYGRAEFQGEQVPTLAELSALLPEDIALALELKTDRFIDPLSAAGSWPSWMLAACDSAQWCFPFPYPAFRPLRPRRLTSPSVGSPYPDRGLFERASCSVLFGHCFCSTRSTSGWPIIAARSSLLLIQRPIGGCGYTGCLVATPC